MNVKTIQETIIKNRVNEAVECLKMATELLRMAEKLGGKMNGLSSALEQRAKDINTQAEALQRHITDHLNDRPVHLPGFTQKVNDELLKKLSDSTEAEV